LDTLESIDIVRVERSEIEAAGIPAIRRTGVTAAARMRESHFDLSEIDYPRLGNIAALTAGGFRKNRVVRITGGKLINILKNAIAEMTVEPNDLKERVAKHVLQPMRLRHLRWSDLKMLKSYAVGPFKSPGFHARSCETE
jgi:hypothetical protein